MTFTAVLYSVAVQRIDDAQEHPVVRYSAASFRALFDCEHGALMQEAWA